MIIKKIKNKGEWYKYKDNVEFLIRPFKFSELSLDGLDGSGLFGKATKEKFMYCLEGWKGLMEEDGKTDLKCDTENKEVIFDYYEKVRTFILQKAAKIDSDLEKSIKN